MMADFLSDKETIGDFHDMRLAVGLIEHDMVSQGKVVDKLAEAVEKIEEMNANLFRMISLHEMKLEGQARNQESTDDDIKELGVRIDKIHNSITRFHPEHKAQSMSEVGRALKEMEKWKYLLIGAVFAFGWLLAHVNWTVFLTLFGGK